jgi:hypothetical protein|tara:strand:+ start:2132 stop:2515 length:384 start_codon:yes stop_codon:yes gene_type:complete
MKVSEFKKVIKPLIKECIKEVILEEGILSNVVSEVARGLQGNIVTETKNKAQEDLEAKAEELERQRQERIKKLNESTRIGNVNVFEGTKEIAETNQASPLQGVSPGDSGVDITGIVGLAGKKWKHLV